MEHFKIADAAHFLTRCARIVTHLRVTLRVNDDDALALGDGLRDEEVKAASLAGACRTHNQRMPRNVVNGLIEIRLDGLHTMNPLLSHVRDGIFANRSALEENVFRGIHDFASPVNNVVDRCLLALLCDIAPILVHHCVKALGMGVRPDKATTEPELFHVLGTDGLCFEFGYGHDGQVTS